MNNVQCHNYSNYGLVKRECWYKEYQTNFVKNEAIEECNEGEKKLFMAHIKNEDKCQNHMWFVDSGCFNHMRELKSLFAESDEIEK